MNFIDTNDPTSFGVLAIAALILIGALVLSRALRPVERLVSKHMPRRPVASKQRKLIPRKELAANTGEMPTSVTANKPRATSRLADAPDFEGQWDRIADRLECDISRVQTAAIDHTKASTQLDAAEFSISELFREFPTARDNINPVTYVEFPGLQHRQPVSEDEAQDAEATPQAASA